MVVTCKGNIYCICIYTLTRIYIYIYYTCVNHKYTRVYIRVCLCIHVHTYVYTRDDTRIYMFIILHELAVIDSQIDKLCYIYL